MLRQRLVALLVMMLAVSSLCFAQKEEIAVTAGGTFTSDANSSFVLICPGVPPCPTVNSTVKSGHRIFVEATPAAQIFNAKIASLYLELPVAVIPSQSLHLSTDAPNFSFGHLSSIFITPALRVKLLPKMPVSPFVSLGGGWAYYVLDNGNNSRVALQYGGGVDLRSGTRHLRFRAEVRDFVTANPNFGNAEAAPFGLATSGVNGLHRHNILLGGGIVVRF